MISILNDNYHGDSRGERISDLYAVNNTDGEGLKANYQRVVVTSHVGGLVWGAREVIFLFR